MPYHNILDRIGNTPLVLINRLHSSKKVKIYAKLESFNPMSSVKDRIGLAMIEEGIASGKIKPDTPGLDPGIH